MSKNSATSGAVVLSRNIVKAPRARILPRAACQGLLIGALWIVAFNVQADPLQRSRDLAAEGAFGDAAHVLQEALHANPTNAEFLMQAARIALWRGDTSSAHAYLRRLTPEQWKNPDARVVLASVLMRDGKYGDAAREYQVVVTDYPQYTDAVEGLKRARQAEKDRIVWRLGATFEQSRFSRSPFERDPWKETTLVVSRINTQGPDFTFEATRYSRFGITAWQYGLTSSFSLPKSRNLRFTYRRSRAVFRPRWEVEVGFSGPLWPSRTKPSRWRHDIRLTRSLYSTDSITKLAADLTHRFDNRIEITLGVEHMRNSVGARATGKKITLRVPIKQHWSLSISGAHSPELLVDGSRDWIRSLSIGLARRDPAGWDFGVALYRENRLGSYVREGAVFSVTRRF